MTRRSLALLVGTVARVADVGAARPSLWRRREAAPLLSVGLAVLLGLLLPAPARAQTTTQVVEYYHTDLLGTVRAVTNQSGEVIRRHDFLPFGEELQPTVPPPDKPLFTGKERDAETGLDYFGARYQRAGVGRFTSIDPAMTLDENLVDPQRWNRYTYARTNPLRWVDPDGRVPGEYYTSGGSYLGSDGAADGYVWMVTNDDDVRAFSKGRTRLGQIDYSHKKGVNAQAAGAIWEVYDRVMQPSGPDVTGNEHEEGFLQLSDSHGETSISWASPGYVSPDRASISINLMSAYGPGSDVTVGVHGHPGMLRQSGRFKYDQPPSGRDLAAAFDSVNLVVACGERDVYFYGGDGRYGHIPLTAFRR